MLFIYMGPTCACATIYGARRLSNYPSKVSTIFFVEKKMKNKPTIRCRIAVDH